MVVVFFFSATYEKGSKEYKSNDFMKFIDGHDTNVSERVILNFAKIIGNP